MVNCLIDLLLLVSLQQKQFNPLNSDCIKKDANEKLVRSVSVSQCFFYSRSLLNSLTQKL